MNNTVQTCAGCIGLYRASSKRALGAVASAGYRANACRMQRPARGVTQMHAECIASKRHHKEGPWLVCATGNAGESLSCAPHAAVCLCTCRCGHAMAASRKRAASAPLPKGDRTQPIPSQRRTAQRPLKGAALPANNKPRTKGLPWWNLPANLTVMPLRQPTNKRILPNIRDSWCGFSWACPLWGL